MLIIQPRELSLKQPVAALWKGRKRERKGDYRICWFDVSVEGVSVHEVSGAQASLHEVSGAQASLHEVSGAQVSLHEVSGAQASLHEVSGAQVSLHERFLFMERVTCMVSATLHSIGSHEVSMRLPILGVKYGVELLASFHTCTDHSTSG